LSIKLTIDLIYPPVNPLLSKKSETYLTEWTPLFFPFSAGIYGNHSTTGTFPVTKGNGFFPFDYWGTAVPGIIPYYFFAFLYFLWEIEWFTLAYA